MDMKISCKRHCEKLSHYLDLVSHTALYISKNNPCFRPWSAIVIHNSKSVSVIFLTKCHLLFHFYNIRICITLAYKSFIDTYNCNLSLASVLVCIGSSQMCGLVYFFFFFFFFLFCFCFTLLSACSFDTCCVHMYMYMYMCIYMYELQPFHTNMCACMHIHTYSKLIHFVNIYIICISF